jgi:integrase
VPIPAVLREHLIEHKLRSGQSEGLLFGRTSTAAFDPPTVSGRAATASTYMGHASVTITLDRYGHLMPGNEDEAAALLDAYLHRVQRRS